MSAASSSFLCYFRTYYNWKIYHIPLTKWFIHIYAYLWGSNPIKCGGIAPLRIILNISQQKGCISPKYATFICDESKYGLKSDTHIMLMVVDYKTNSVTLSDNDLVLNSVTNSSMMTWQSPYDSLHREHFINPI